MPKAITTTSASLLRLLQLSSASLPVGGFSFSQGLETAVEAGWIRDMAQTRQWLQLQLMESVARVDLPILAGAIEALQEQDDSGWRQWNEQVLANRESKEMRLTDSAMGEALKRLLGTLDISLPENLPSELSYVAMYGVAANHWHISVDLAGYGFVWSWLENQIAAATKLVPLGQTQAQQLCGDLQAIIPDAITLSESLNTETLGGSLPALAIASSLHETQYTRLFRS